MKNQNSISNTTFITKTSGEKNNFENAKKMMNNDHVTSSSKNSQVEMTNQQTSNSNQPTTEPTFAGGVSEQEIKEQEVIIYEFHFPMELCGRLIGRQGVHVDYIRQKTQVDLVVRDDSVPSEKQVVALHGRRVDIERAIEMIAKRFPPARYPQVTFKPINKKVILRQRPPERVPIPTSTAQLHLPDGSPTEVLVTSVVSCNHIFVQQTSHPTYAELARLDNSMTVFYHHTEVTPPLPRPVQAGVICAAPTQAGWFRALITMYNSNDDMAMIKFLDYGGYLYVSAASLRVLRQDFMVIPFQATEAYLDNVVPVDNQEDFPPESIEAVKSTILGLPFKAMITGYHYDNTPFIQLSRRNDFQRLVNIEIQKLINHQQSTVNSDETILPHGVQSTISNGPLGTEISALTSATSAHS